MANISDGVMLLITVVNYFPTACQVERSISIISYVRTFLIIKVIDIFALLRTIEIEEQNSHNKVLHSDMIKTRFRAAYNYII